MSEVAVHWFIQQYLDIYSNRLVDSSRINAISTMFQSYRAYLTLVLHTLVFPGNWLLFPNRLLVVWWKMNDACRFDIQTLFNKYTIIISGLPRKITHYGLCVIYRLRSVGAVLAELSGPTHGG